MRRSGYTCVRITFCTLNVIVWLAGCAILGVGIWLYIAYQGYANFLPSYRLLSADALCIASGVVTFIIAFLGYCGSWFQSRCLLVSYFVLVTLVFSLEFTAGTLIYLYRHNVSDVLKEEFKTGIRVKYLNENEQTFTETWDRIHVKFACCGVGSYADWHQSEAWPEQDWVPDSCCVEQWMNVTNCGKRGDVTLYHRTGCLERFHLWLIERLHVLGLIILAFTFIQLFGLVASMLLCCTLRQRSRRRKP